MHTQLKSFLGKEKAELKQMSWKSWELGIGILTWEFQELEKGLTLFPPIPT